VWRLASKHLAYVKIGRSIRYCANDIDAFINANLKPAARK
jgi:hypothetical protein